MANSSTDDDTTESRQPAAKTPSPKSEWDEPGADWFPIGRAVFRFGIADPDTSATGETPPADAALFSVEAFEQFRNGEEGKIANYEPKPPSLEELTNVLQRTTHAREVEIDQEACCFHFRFVLPGGGASATCVTPWVLLAMPDRPLPIDPRVEAEALFNKEGLVLLRKSDVEARHEGRQNKAVRDATGLVWRQYMLGAFNRLVADRRVKIYARAGSVTDPLRRLPSDLWPRLEVLDWQHGVAGDPEGTIYYSVHALSSSPAASAKQKAIAADEKSAIEALAKQLKLNHDMTWAEALSFCKSSQFRISQRGFEHHVWPDAREKAGLPRKAPSGRKKKSPR